jgi:membrane protein DedA with SNARE-associated domain
VEGILEHAGYATLLALLLAAGLGFPLPEELTQLTAGVLAHQGPLRIEWTLVTAWTGIVGGDVALFALARRHGPRMLASRAVARVLTPARRDWLDRHFARHSFLTVALARHAPGIRVAAFALAGAHGVPFRTFVLADGLSALLSVPLMVGLGYFLSQHLVEVERDVRLVEIAVAAILLVAVGAGIALRRCRNARP